MEVRSLLGHVPCLGLCPFPSMVVRQSTDDEQSLSRFWNEEGSKDEFPLDQRERRNNLDQSDRRGPGS